MATDDIEEPGIGFPHSPSSGVMGVLSLVKSLYALVATFPTVSKPVGAGWFLCLDLNTDSPTKGHFILKDVTILSSLPLFSGNCPPHKSSREIKSSSRCIWSCCGQMMCLGGRHIFPSALRNQQGETYPVVSLGPPLMHVFAYL